MFKRALFVVSAIVCVAAGPVSAQCDDPNNMLTGDACGFDASLGGWTAIPIIDPLDPNWGTPSYVAGGGRTSPGAMEVVAVMNPGTPVSSYNAGAQYCVENATLVPGSQLHFGAWVNPTDVATCQAILYTDPSTDCSIGPLEVAQVDNSSIAIGQYNQINALGIVLDITSASATAHSIAMRISCDNIIDTPFTATFDDAHLSVVPRLFRVTVTGTVEWNQVTAPPLGAANEGDPVEMSFLVDANSYLDGIMFPTRGYVIDQGSFTMTLGSAAIGLQNPFPAGTTPYFVISNDDPAVDGFMLAIDPDAGYPMGVPLDQVGIFGNFLDNFYVTYDGSVLGSLDIEDATGLWGFNLLEVYNWTVDDDGFNAIGIIFTGMNIGSYVEGQLFIDGFESGDTAAWSNTVP